MFYGHICAQGRQDRPLDRGGAPLIISKDNTDTEPVYEA